MKESFQPAIDIWKDARGQLQVPLCTKQRLVPKVGNEQRQACIEIVTVTVPPLEAMYRKRVAQVM